MPSLPVSVAGFEAFGLADLGLQTSRRRLAGRRGAAARELTVHVTGYHQRLRLTDMRDIDLMSLDPGAPDFLMSRAAAPTAPSCCVRRADRGRLLRLARVHAVVEPARGRQRRVRAVRLGPAPHPEPGGAAIACAAATPSARASLQHRPARARDRQRRPVPEASRVLPRWTCASRRRIVFDRFIMTVYADFANVTLTREVVQVVTPTMPDGQPYARSRASA